MNKSITMSSENLAELFLAIPILNKNYVRFNNVQREGW